jgi:hypothetical protein
LAVLGVDLIEIVAFAALVFGRRRWLNLDSGFTVCDNVFVGGSQPLTEPG